MTDNLEPAGWRPILLVATAAVLILAGVQTVALSTAPTIDASGADVARWLVAHRDAVRWSVWATTAGVVAYSVMIALLRQTLPPVYRDLYLMGGLTAVITGAVQAWLWAALSLRAEETPPVVVRAVLDVAIYWGPLLTGAMITMIAPVTLLALRRAAGLPRWLGLFGAVVVGEQGVETVTIFSSSGFTAPGGPMNMQLGAALVITWTLAFSLCRAFARRDALGHVT